MNTELNIIQEISTITSLELSPNTSFFEMELKLAAYVNDLIKHDFEKLIFILYRVDVFESKLKDLLKQNADEDAGRMIAQLIIERQIEKIKSRQQFKNNRVDDDAEERW